MATHDSMVKTLADYLKGNGYTNVLADVPGFARPAEICWKDRRECHIPDVTATHAQTRYVFEVETDESIGIEHTESQFKLFNASCTQFGGVFCVVVPKSVLPVANQVLQRLGINAQVWSIG